MDTFPFLRLGRILFFISGALGIAAAALLFLFAVVNRTSLWTPVIVLASAFTSLVVADFIGLGLELVARLRHLDAPPAPKPAD